MVPTIYLIDKQQLNYSILFQFILNLEKWFQEQKPPPRQTTVNHFSSKDIYTVVFNITVKFVT